MKGRCILKKRTLQLSMFLLLCVFILNASGCGNSNNSPVANSYAGSKYETTEKNETANNGYTVTGTKDFSDGYAWILFKQGENGQSKRACIDTNGKIQFVLDDIVEGNLTNEKVRDFKSGYAVVKDNSNNTYIIDTKGNIVSSSKSGNYDHIVCYGDGYFLTEKKNNNLHEVNYTFSVIDASENYITKDCFSYDSEITDYSRFEYRGEAVFSHSIGGVNGKRDYECVNAKTGKTFKLNLLNAFYDFEPNGSIIVSESHITQILHSDGSVTNVNVEDCYAKSHLSNNYFVYKNPRYSADDSLFIYDISTNQSHELYSCKKGIEANVCGYDENGFLLDITDNSNGYNNAKHWFVIVDYQGNELFAPIEGTPHTKPFTNIALSCNRIIVQKNQNQLTGENTDFYDNKGNLIDINNKDMYHFGDIYKDNLLIVNTKGGEIVNANNYIDINGNLLFPDGTITL